MQASGRQGSTRKDFFISYNSADIRWAEWIAWQLEEEGYVVVLQSWDFRPGHNFVLEIDKATRQAEHTLAILSPAYLNGPYAQPEWAEAFRRDPRGEEGLLIPVLVQECEVAGLLGLVIPIHLVGKSESAARQTLLAGVTSKRAKPEVPPSFPSSLRHSVSLSTRFPGILPRIHTNLSPRNPFCIGRDQILEEAQKSLNAGLSVALTQPSDRSDPSPTDKNQTAREYVYRYQSDYRDVFWLNAGSRSSLLDDFRQIARVLTLPGITSNDQQLLIANVKNWFDTHTNWLLIFDNVEDDQRLKPFLPQSNNGHTLLISHVLSPGSTAHSLELPASRPEERELIQRLARTVGGSLTSPSVRKVLDLYRPTTIGRAPNNTIVLNDPTVAPYHAEIQLTGQGYTLRNQDARTSTRINSQPLNAGETHVLTPSNTIMVGKTTLLYQVDNRMQTGQGTHGFSPPRAPTISVPSFNQPASSPSRGPTNFTVPFSNAQVSPGYPMPIHPSPQSIPPPLFDTAYESNFNNVKIPLKRKRRRPWILIGAVILILFVISITSSVLVITHRPITGGGPPSLNQPVFYAAIFEQSSGPAWVGLHGMTSDQYQQAFTRLTAQGYRLLHVSGYSVNGQAHYAAIFEQSNGPAWVARQDMTSDQYQQALTQLTAQGYRLVDVSGYSVSGQAHYAAIFEQSSGPPRIVRQDMTSDQYQQALTQLTSQGYRLLHVSGYGINGQAHYAAIFEQSSGPPRVARQGMTSDQYQQTFNQLTSQGYRLVDVSGYGINGQALYAAIFEQSSGPPRIARHGMTPDQYQQTFNQLTSQGYRLVDVSGYQVIPL